MKKIIILSVLFFTAGCTQIVTTPIKIVGATAEATIGVVGAGMKAVMPDSDE